VLLGDRRDAKPRRYDHLNIGPSRPLRAKDGLIIVAVGQPGLVDQVLARPMSAGLARRSAFLTNTDSRGQPRRASKRRSGGVRALDGPGAGDRLSREECALPGRVRSIGERSSTAGRAREILMTRSTRKSAPIETLAPSAALRTPADVRLPPPALASTHGRYTTRAKGRTKGQAEGSTVFQSDLLKIVSR